MQKEITIRPMRFDDLDRVYALEVQLFPNPWPKAFFETDLTLSSNLGFVVESQGEVIGYSMASCKDSKFHVTNIAVAETHQRKGLGTGLMDVLESIAVERGCWHAYLEVRTNNHAAVVFYQSRGYEIAYTHPQYYIDGDDAYVMVKDLSQRIPKKEENK